MLTKAGEAIGEDERRRNIDRLADLRRLYEEHADFVRRAVIHLGGPRSDVDDLVQDVFLVALRKRSTFEGRAAVTTWLYAIAVRVVAGARRKSRVRELLAMLPGVEPVATETPAQVFEHREASRLVYALLDRMAEKKRTVFILHELAGMTGEEIAAVVACPEKTVWTRLFHARKEFAGLLRKHELRSAREIEAVRRHGS